MFVLVREKERFYHFGVEEIAIEAIQLGQPKVVGIKV